MSPIRLLLADDNQLARAGVRTAVAGAADIVLVGEAADGPEAVRLAERLKPDVLVADLHLPGLDGVGVLRQLSTGVRPKSLLLLARGEAICMVEAIGYGAYGFLHLPEAATQFVDAVRVVAAGGHWLRPPLCEDAFGCAAQVARAVRCDPYHALTPREREVLLMAAKGDTNGVIGKRLFISPRTVELHRSRAMKKLGIGSVPELVRFAIRRGLLDMEA